MEILSDKFLCCHRIGIVCGVSSVDDATHLNLVFVESAKMQVCNSCTTYGTPVTIKQQSSTTPATPIQKIEPYSGKDIFKGMNQELIDDYGTLMREARQRQSLSREELGARISEKTNTIAKIENQELRPSDKKARILEKNLGISLYLTVEPAVVKKRQVQGITIGDLLKDDD